MSKLSEEEILDKLRKMLYHTQKANECGLSNNDFKEDIEALEGILDLYNKEKEKNKYLESQIPIDKIFYYSYKDYISKDKIREKIEEFKELSTKIRFGTNKNIPRDLKRIDFAINMLEELLQEGDK